MHVAKGTAFCMDGNSYQYRASEVLKKSDGEAYNLSGIWYYLFYVMSASTIERLLYMMLFSMIIRM